MRAVPTHAAALCASLVLGTVGVTAATVTLAAPAQASTPWPGHPHRHLIRHTVHRGETVTGLAVRYHAWTRELIALNHLGKHPRLRIGEHLRIPVVDKGYRHHHATKHHPVKHHHKKHHKKHPTKHPTKHPSKHPWHNSGFSRAHVRSIIEKSARRHGVPASLALAVAWQESGWQEHVISSADAVGVMQLLPSTGRWMSTRAHRKLNIYGTRDNVLGGVLLLHYLLAHTRHDRNAIGAYYEGLGAVRHSGLYPSTRAYVRSVTAIRRHLLRTGHPAS